MPLIRPEIQNVLRSAGLLDSKKKGASAEETTLIEKLNDAGLSLEEILENLAFTAKESANEGLRVRCLETALKAHGALKDTTPPVPSFTIVIQEAGAGSPGQPSVQGVNPILLPRALLKTLQTDEGEVKN